jgi:hypothetical protein
VDEAAAARLKDRLGFGVHFELAVDALEVAPVPCRVDVRCGSIADIMHLTMTVVFTATLIAKKSFTDKKATAHGVD